MKKDLNLKTQEKLTPKAILGQNRGQLLVEYIILILVVVAISTLMTRLLVGRGEGSEGIVITKWTQLIEMIGQDLGD